MNRQQKQQLKQQQLNEQQNKYYDLLIKICDKNKVDFILETINEDCKHKRMPKYSNEYYLYYILMVLKHVQTWASLTYVINDENLNLSTNHYKTIQDKHLEWSKLDIYEKAYKKFLNSAKNIDLKGSKNLNLFIDSSNIYNKNGCTNVGYGNDPKKKQTKISAICDKNKTILSLAVVDIINREKIGQARVGKRLNQKEAVDRKIKTLIEKKIKENKNDKNLVDALKSLITKENKNIQKENKNVQKNEHKFLAKTTLKHDSQTIEKSLDSLLINSKKSKKIHLIGDIGYMRTKKDKEKILKNYNVEIIHPQKKNQKDKTSEKNKKLLKERYVIENIFCKLKKFDRICMRKDKLTSTFKGFLFLATIISC